MMRDSGEQEKIQTMKAERVIDGKVEGMKE